MTSGREAPVEHLFNRGFALLCSVGFVSQGCYWLLITALQWQVANLPDSGPAEVGLLYFLQLLPYLLIAPFAGVVLDHFNRKVVIAVALAMLSLVGFSGGIAGNTGALGFATCAILAMCVGACSPFNDAGHHSIMPSTVPTQLFPRAVSLFAASQNIARTIGPILAGGLLLLGGAPLALVCGGAIYVLVILLVIGYPRQSASRGPRTESVLAQIGGGFAVLAKNAVVRRAIAFVALTGLLVLSSASMFSVIVTSRFDAGEVGFALMLAMAGIGAVIGALSPFPRARNLKTIAWLHTLSALALVGIAFSPSLIGACFSVILMAASANAAMIRLNTIVQSQLDDRVRGRVMSLYVWAWGGSLPLGGLLLGWLGSLITVSGGLAVMAGAIGTVALFTALSRDPMGR